MLNVHFCFAIETEVLNGKYISFNLGMGLFGSNYGNVYMTNLFQIIITNHILSHNILGISHHVCFGKCTEDCLVF